MAQLAVGESSDGVVRKNEAILGGIVGKSFVFVEFEKGGSVFEVVFVALHAVGLDLAELLEGLLELAGEAMAVESELGESVVGVDDIESDSGFIVGRVGGAVEEIGFEGRDAVESPGRVGELLSEVGFGGSGGAIFIEELAAVELVGGWIFGRQNGGVAGESVGEGVARGLALAGFGARSGGMEGVGAVGAGAAGVGAGGRLGVAGDWGREIG